MVREKQNIASFRHEQRYRRKKEEKTKVEDGHSLLSATESKNFQQYTLSLTKEKSKYFCDHERYKDTLSKPNIRLIMRHFTQTIRYGHIPVSLVLQIIRKNH